MAQNTKNTVNKFIDATYVKRAIAKLKIFVTQNKKITLIIFGGITVALVFAVVMANTSRHAVVKNQVQQGELSVAPKTPSTENYMSQQLNDITIKLANIQKNMSTHQSTINLDSIRSEVSNLIHETQQLSEHSNQIITNKIQASTEVLEKRLASIKSELQKLQDEKNHTAFIAPTNLPFHVLHIDNIQNQNVVTVQYNNTIFPINIGDYLSGWKMISSDFVSQKCEFVNKNKQHVIVDLNRVTIPRA